MKTIILLLLCGAAYAAEPKSTPESIAKGQGIFQVNCATCHGDKGDGNGPAAAALNPKPRNFTDAKSIYKGPSGKGKKKNPPAKDIFEVISKGITGTAMVSFAYLTEEDRWALAHYVVSLRGKK